MTTSGYAYEIYSNPEYGYFAYYMDTTKPNTHLNISTLEEISHKKTYSKYSDHSIYIFNRIPDFSFENLTPYEIPNTIQSYKPLLWLLRISNDDHYMHACVMNAKQEYDLYIHGFHTHLNWVIKPDLVSTYCNTNFK